LIFTIYGHPTAYNCDRKIQSDVPDKADIVLSDASESSRRLKQHGFDYVYVQNFALSNEAYLQAFPVSFVLMMDSYPQYFQKVYDNSQVYQGGGVSVYKVL